MPIAEAQPADVVAERLGSAGASETRLFRVALALVALAVVDDAFVHPELGTAAADHLISGGVPLAVAIALALAYPRLRAGARAGAALVCGALAMVGGTTDGIRHAVVDRLSGDDASAVLAALAGVALLGQGAVLLWRTRRLDERPGRRYARRALIGVAAGAVTLLVVVPAGVAILATHKARAPVTAADLGHPYERVGFTTADGLRLAGWYVPSRNRAAVIVFPGRSGTLRHARLLARHGYGVLLFDRRGEGESEGDINLYGWGGAPDLVAAVAFLRARPDVDSERIGGLGLSVGGELLLQTAAATSGLRAVVSEGAGVRSLAEHLETPGIGKVQRWLSPAVAQTAAVAVLSNHRPLPDLTELVRRIAPRSVLLIRALDGHPDEVLNRVYAANSGASLWELESGGHTGALSARPREYERRVMGFLDRAARAPLRRYVLRVLRSGLAGEARREPGGARMARERTRRRISWMSTAPSHLRELNHRSTDGIDVRLLWNRLVDELFVAVFDAKTGDSFEVAVEAGERALEVFHHPFAFAAFRGAEARLAAAG